MSVRFRKGIGQSMKAETDTWTVLEKGLMLLIRQNFKDFRDFYVISDLKRYKPSMDASIFAEKTGQIPEVAEIYWKGEFVCSVSMAHNPDMALQKINDGLIELLTRKKVRVL